MPLHSTSFEFCWRLPRMEKHMDFFDIFMNAVVKAKYRSVEKMLRCPVAIQNKIMHRLVKKARYTHFGREHAFDDIHDYNSFKSHIPLRNYEGLGPYIDRIKRGQREVLWPGLPKYFGISSGTTGRVKYIPVTKASLWQNQINGPKYFLWNYAYRKKQVSHLKGKILLFSDGHVFDSIAGFKTAPISCIAHSHVPKLYALRCLPPGHANSIPDFDKRMEAIIASTLGQDIRAIVAMPVWLMIYLRRLKQITGKDFHELFLGDDMWLDFQYSTRNVVGVLDFTRTNPYLTCFQLTYHRCVTRVDTNFTTGKRGKHRFCRTGENLFFGTDDVYMHVHGHTLYPRSTGVQGPGTFHGFVDGANHVESLLGKTVVFAVNDGPEPLDGVFQ